MSLTSCYRYVLELPLNTLNSLLKAAFSESDSAGILSSLHWENQVIGAFTATVDARLADLDTHPPIMTLGVGDLSLSLHLHMRIEVKINEIAGLDLIIYIVDFDFPGMFEKDTSTPPRLLMKFPSVTVADLNLVVTGGQVPLAAELIEPGIHALYAANPSLGHTVTTGVPWPVPGEPTVVVTTDIYDDVPGAPGFRGAITVQVLDVTHIQITMPGHFKIQGLAPNFYVNTDMTVQVKVLIEQTDGKISAKLSGIQQSDVTVTFVTPSIYDIVAKPILADNIAAKLRTIGDQEQALPTNAEVQTLITGRLLAFAPALSVPVFTPGPPAAGQIDLATFVPTTVAQQALALQLVPLADGTTCDMPNMFARPDGFAVAVAAVEVNVLMEPIFAANRGDQHIQGYDMTVNSLTGTLSDPGAHGQTRGHIWIEGETEVHVDCWPDPDVSFWGPIFLVPATESDGTVTFTADAGEFGADDPCCGDVNPADIANLIEGEKSLPIALPRDFSGVGEIDMTVAEVEIFAAGIVIFGNTTFLTNHSLSTEALRKTLYWFFEQAGGG